MRNKSRLNGIGLTMVLLLSRAAFGQDFQPVWITGIVKGIGSGQTTFVVLDNNNTPQTVTVDSSTKYMLGKNDATFAEVVVVGEPAFAKVGQNGVATDVYNKNQSGRWTLAQMKNLLGASDEECAVLGPAIQRVAQLQQQSMINRRVAKGLQPTPVDLAVQKLRAVATDPSTAAGDIHDALEGLREKRALIAGDLKRARQALLPLLTIRQEAVLTQMGILE